MEQDRPELSMQGWVTGTNGTQLWDMLQNSFAWVSTTGYTNKANATTLFPVVVGEFGTSFANVAVRISQSQMLSTRALGMALGHICHSGIYQLAVISTADRTPRTLF